MFCLPKTAWPPTCAATQVSAKKSPTPTLDEFSRDLTQLARSGKLDPVIGRDTEKSDRSHVVL